MIQFFISQPTEQFKTNYLVTPNGLMSSFKIQQRVKNKRNEITNDCQKDLKLLPEIFKVFKTS